MGDTYWKSFELGELFDRNNKHKITDAIKLLNMSNNKDEVFTIANITASKENNGCAGYLEETDEIKNKKKKNYLTIGSDASTFCFYHDYEFITTGHNNLLEVKNSTLKKDLDTHPEAYRFLAKLISKTLMLPGINRFSRGISSDFNREIILLPVIEVKGTEEYIWEENGKYFTLAVDYIKELMEEAKIRKEEKTIRLYETEREKYEAEREKYEAAYLKEQSSLVWKAFELEELFFWSKRKDLSLKNYNSIDRYKEGYVEAVTGSKTIVNNYYNKKELPEGYPTYSNCISLNTNGSIGHCFYNPGEIISPTSSVHILLHKNMKLEKFITPEINSFLAKSITHIFTSQPFGYTFLIDNDKFNREIILLPVIEVKGTEEYIWEENGKYFTLAVNTISYLYLQGQVNIQQRKIDTYTYKY